MSLLDVNLDDYQEPQIAAQGEYEVQLVGVSDAKEGPKGQYYQARLEIIGTDEEYETVFHNISVPNPDDEKSKKNFKLGLLRNFCEAFQIVGGPNGIDLKDGLGKSAYAILEIEPESDYGPARNRVKKFVIAK